MKQQASLKGMGDGTIFMGGIDLWRELTSCKDFNLAIVGGLGWMKWLKSGAGKYLYFMQLFLHYIPFGENFIG